MTMENVEAAVLSAARENAKRIVEEAGAEREAKLAAARTEMDAQLAAAKSEALARSARETSRQLGRARQEGRLELLRAKNEVLDRVFAEAAEHFRTMDDGSYRGLVASWLADLPADAGGAVKVSPRDVERFGADFLARANEGRGGGGLFTGMYGDPSVPDGCLVEGEDFTVELTIRRRLEELRESLAAELSKELFSR